MNDLAPVPSAWSRMTKARKKMLATIAPAYRDAYITKCAALYDTLAQFRRDRTLEREQQIAERRI